MKVLSNIQGIKRIVLSNLTVMLAVLLIFKISYAFNDNVKIAAIISFLILTNILAFVSISLNRFPSVYVGESINSALFTSAVVTVFVFLFQFVTIFDDTPKDVVDVIVALAVIVPGLGAFTAVISLSATVVTDEYHVGFNDSFIIFTAEVLTLFLAMTVVISYLLIIIMALAIVIITLLVESKLHNK